MKKILIALLLIISMMLSGCEFLSDLHLGNGSSDLIDGANQNGDTVAEEGHTDEDNNGLCDSCKKKVTVDIALYNMNDFHGKMSESGNQPGADELSTYLKNASNNQNTILLSSGDMWQGGSESNLTKGLIVTDWMNELDFAAMTLGNHEFDWGEEYIIENNELAEFPLLAINVFDKDTNQRVEYCAPSVTVEVSGIQVGIIGAIGDCYSSISKDKVEGVYFKVGSELTKLVKAEATKLRNEGVDLIVYSLHDGASVSQSSGMIQNSYTSSYYDMSLSSEGYVDIVFEGHTHKSYAVYDNYGVYHLQGGGDNAGITHASVSVNFANSKVKVRSARVISNTVYEIEEDDPLFLELFEKYKEFIAKGAESIGYNSEIRRSSELCRLVAKLYADHGETIWGDEYDIVLGGGYLSTRSPYNLDAGDVTYSELLALLPFDNAIVLCSVSGASLKQRFIETDNSNYYISYSEYGESIKDSIDPRGTYYIIVDAYTSQYGPNNLTVIEEFDPTFFARDLLAEYIRLGGLE